MLSTDCIHMESGSASALSYELQGTVKTPGGKGFQFGEIVEKGRI